MTKTGVTFFIGLILVLGLAGFGIFKLVVDKPVVVEDQNDNNQEFLVLNDYVKIKNLKSGDTIQSPLTIEGEARGWYFEGSFPIELRDGAGEIIAKSYVQSQGDWMTTEWVPFKGKIEFTVSEDTVGTLVFIKDNPSGLPENDDSVSIPVSFSKSLGTTVKVFWTNSQTGVDCKAVTAKTRIVPTTTAVAKAAIEELLKGPTSQESTSEGLTTNIPAGVVLNKIEIKEGTAYVDFSDNMSGGSCRVSAISSQINATLKQFSTIKKVVISANGNTDEVLQP